MSAVYVATTCLSRAEACRSLRETLHISLCILYIQNRWMRLDINIEEFAPVIWNDSRVHVVLEGKNDGKRRGLEGTLCNGLNHLLKDRKSYRKVRRSTAFPSTRDVDCLQRSEAAEAPRDGRGCWMRVQMMVHFLVNNMKQNPLKVRAQSLRLGRAGMFTGAELWAGTTAWLQRRQYGISYWISKPAIV